MTFGDRTDAGRKLAEALVPVLKPPCVVAGIPRGGISVALPISERFHLPLTVVYARKLTAPAAPEFLRDRRGGSHDHRCAVGGEPRALAG
jgi:putative phosphoribosyl transferase